MTSATYLLVLLQVFTIQAYVSIGTLRLVSKESTNSYRSGRLEVYHYQASSGSNWTTFCYSNFNSRDADIACQDLGFPRASTYGRVGTFGYDQGSGSQSITYLSCPSSATSLQSCSYSSSSTCSHYNDVAITCIYVNALNSSVDSSSGGAGTSGLLIVGVVVGALFLCSILCVGGVLCATVIGVIYHTNKTRSPRTTIVQHQLQSTSDIGTHHISDMVAKKNDAQTSNYSEPEVEDAATETKIEDDINYYTSDDEKAPII